MLVLPAVLALANPPAAQELASPPIGLAWRQGLLCVPIGLMGGKPTWFLLDTGCYRSLLTRRAYARLRAAGAEISEDGTLTARGASVGGYSVPPLRFGRESDRFDFTVDGAADGYLGMDFLEHYRVGLDLGEKKLRLWPSAIESPKATKEWFAPIAGTKVWDAPLLSRGEGKCVFVDVGNLTVPMVVDTGCPDTFLHTDVADLLADAKKGGSVSAMFYNGMHKIRTYTVPLVGIAGLSLPDRSISVAAVTRMVGLLGRDLLAPLRVLIDYPAARMFFAKTEFDPTEVPMTVYDGPRVTLLNGVVVRYPQGAVAHVPAFCTYAAPAGYREILHADQSMDLVPARRDASGRPQRPVAKLE